ncbi:MAG TPA: MFS transporter [Chloroflexota bacterium]|nr:MFS transporter [Chloroflexota bacterium]
MAGVRLPRGGPARPAPRLFYGWIIVGAVVCLLAVAYVVWYTFTLFLVALVREFGWTRAEVAGAFSLYVLVHAGCSPITGRLVDRFGPRPLVHLGALLVGLALVGCSQLTARWQLYLFFGVLAAIGVTMMGWVPCITLVGRWFSRRLGLAVGLAGAGIGVGTFIGAPVVQFLIETHGWRTAYLALAGALALLPQPLALLLCPRPEARGLARDGAPLPVPEGPAGAAPAAPARPDPRVVDPAWVQQEWTVSRAVRTRRFQLLFTTFALISFGVQQTHAHQAAYLIGSGYDPLLAATVVGAVGLASIAGKILVGTTSDWLGREPVLTLSVGAGVGAMLLLLAAAGGTLPAPLLFLYAGLFALSYSVNASLAPSIASDLFYGRHYGAIFGVLNVSAGLGGATGAWLGGFLFDRTGSYQGVWLVIIVAFALAMTLIWIAAPRHVVRTPGQARRAARAGPAASPAVPAPGAEP